MDGRLGLSREKGKKGAENVTKSAATGEVIFQLPDRLTKPADVQCDGSYLVAGYGSGEILILDLRNMLL